MEGGSDLDDDVEDLEDAPEETFRLSETVVMFPRKTLNEHDNIFEGIITTSLLDENLPCVIKVMPYHNKVNKESEVLQKIGSHAHVIHLLQSGTFCDFLVDYNYIVIEKCHELNLGQYTLSHNKASTMTDSQWGLCVCEQIIDGMKFIHEKSIIHKDLKPSNILLSHDLKIVKIADFGSSQELKTTSSKAFCQTMFGTLGYRPPESFGGSYVSLKTDIFSLGALFCFILSNGENPFGVNEDLWDHNAKNGIISISNLIVSNVKETKHLLESMLRIERRRRPSIWQVAAHPCWRKEMVQYDSDYHCDDEIVDCDAIINEQDTAMIQNAEQEGTLQWRAFLKIYDRQQKREKVLVIFDRENQNLVQFDTKDHSLKIHSREKWNDEMKKGYFTTASLESHIYVLMKTKSMYRLNYRDVTPRWEKMADMINDDLDVLPQAVAVSGAIYVVGGTYGTTQHYHNFQSVFKYTPRTNKWTRLGAKKWNIREAALAVANQRLYCMGGEIYNYQVLRIVETCDLVKDEWDEVAELNEARYSASAASFESKIFVFGGLDNYKSELSSVERYDPEINQWTIVKSMTQTRSSLSFRCHVIKNKIYAIGGTQPSETIEYYDVDTDEWTAIDIERLLIEIYSSVIISQ